jgi:hypothetical protein
MKTLRVSLSSALLLAVSFLIFDVATVQAVTCASTCSQIRRACRSVAMNNTKVAYANCDDAREACWAACEANAEQCPIDCDTNYQACVGGGGTTCDADLALCLDDCANCRTNCNAERVTCKDDAKLARDEANLLCDAVRESCGTECVDPIDPECVRACKAGRSACDGDAKRDEKTCMAGCPKGTGQKACARSCRRDKNAAIALCANQEVLCYGVCANLAP